MYLNQHHLQVSGGKAALVYVARVLRYVRAGQDSLETEVNDTTSDSELQSSDDSKTNQMTQKTMRYKATRKWTDLSNIV